eukprot:CAMPEP_0198229124 /NCGR_PEP_ID=MMETSP1445-20131203/113959_1 /TAXON_ID=36898 /ORGANISM="Pyramimonas sp., Strain CCMP2087" /LENGTH=1098 /DNA_ID=CAMNT_0043909567 /DNA_START=43 /DNA_END=3337 /DNA_ORIENTATION=-
MSTWRDLKLDLQPPAFHAAREGDVEALLDFFLSDPRANVNGQDEEGNTILHLAGRQGHANIVQFMNDIYSPDKEIDITLKNKDGKTAIELAKRYDRTEAAELLTKLSLKINMERGTHQKNARVDNDAEKLKSMEQRLMKEMEGEEPNQSIILYDTGEDDPTAAVASPSSYSSEAAKGDFQRYRKLMESRLEISRKSAKQAEIKAERKEDELHGRVVELELELEHVREECKMESRSFEMKSAQTRAEAAASVEAATKKMENWQKKALFATEQHDVIKARNVEVEGWHQENFVPLQQRSRQNFKELEEMTAKAAKLQLEVLKEQELRALSTAELNEARIYVQVLEEKLSVTKAGMGSDRERLKSFEEAYNTMEAKLRERTLMATDLEVEIKRRDGDIQSKAAINDRLVQEQAEQTDRVKALEKTTASDAQRQKKLVGVAEALKAENAGLAGQLAEWKTEMTQKLTDSEAKLAETDALSKRKVQQLESEVSVWTDEMKMRKKESAASDERSKLMQASVDRLSSENSQMEDTEGQLLEELKQAVERGVRAGAQHAEARGQLEEAVAHLTEASHNAARKAEEAISLHSEIEILRKDAAISDERSKLMQETLDRLSSNTSQMQNKQEREWHERETQEAKKKLERAETAEHATRQKLEEALQTLSLKETECAASTKTLMAVVQHNETFEAQAKEAREEAKASGEALRVLQKKHSFVVTSADTVREQLQAYKVNSPSLNVDSPMYTYIPYILRVLQKKHSFVVTSADTVREQLQAYKLKERELKEGLERLQREFAEHEAMQEKAQTESQRERAEMEAKQDKAQTESQKWKADTEAAMAGMRRMVQSEMEAKRRNFESDMEESRKIAESELEEKQKLAESEVKEKRKKAESEVEEKRQKAHYEMVEKRKVAESEVEEKQQKMQDSMAMRWAQMDMKSETQREKSAALLQREKKAHANTLKQLEMQQALVEELSSKAAAALEHHTLHTSSALTAEQAKLKEALDTERKQYHEREQERAARVVEEMEALKEECKQKLNEQKVEFMVEKIKFDKERRAMESELEDISQFTSMYAQDSSKSDRRGIKSKRDPGNILRDSGNIRRDSGNIQR